jgi:hypothetical protein
MGCGLTMDDALAMIIIVMVIAIAAMFCYFTYNNASKGVDMAGVEIKCPSNKVVGLYDQYSKMIIIETAGKTPQEVEKIMLHEYKHYLDDVQLAAGIYSPTPEFEAAAVLYEQTHYIAEVD